MPITFAHIIRQHRHRLEITQTQAAALVGVSLRTWQKWERGPREPLYASERDRVLQVLSGTAPKP